MSLTKRQKMLSAVLLIGLGGLVADRTILRPQGGPRAASADSRAPSQSPVVVSGNVPVAEDPPARAGTAERLNNLLSGKEAGSDELRDPFSLPASWSDSAATNAERVPDTTGGFIQRHQLKAVVIQGGESCAQVDDSFLVPGQSVDGFKLVSVDHRSAVFERDGIRAVLDLAGK
jgi:hypothetical protein